MIYYPLSSLMLAGIKDILIISTPQDTPLFENMLGTGEQWGINLSYKVQPSPDGLAQAFLLGEEFIGNDDVCLILGDNIFYGYGFSKMLKKAVENVENNKQANIFGYYVTDPDRYGVAEFNEERRVISIEEKPQNPKSNYAVVGLYFYPNSVVEVAKSIKPSARGELEITTVNQEYLQKNELDLSIMGRGMAWLDTGTHESLIDASNYIATIERRQGLKVACLEEIAWRNKWISNEELMKHGEALSKNQYGQYLLSLIDNPSYE